MRERVPLAMVLLATLLSACSAGNVFELEVGTCFDDPVEQASEVADVPVVECSEPHANEVFATVELPGGEFPGVEATQDSAFASCLERFEGWAGIALHASALQVSVITPTVQSWQLKDDRSAACVVQREDGAAMSGSMRGAGA